MDHPAKDGRLWPKKLPDWFIERLKICQACYWAIPESYKHVALRLIRRLDVTWVGEETSEFDRLARKAFLKGQTLPEIRESGAAQGGPIV